jgi:redox-sensitive bicupin YhaK (pirin superfamily)
MENSVLHKANTRGHANHGWLDTHHTFSFGGYMNPSRMNFGVLRVLNDDVVAGGGGFGTHPHSNMEIISIPLKGNLEHQDSMGNVQVIEQNDVQIMSAGTGVYHSEYNQSKAEPVNFLQIWVFPKEHNISPRYDQKTFLPEERKNRLQLIVSANKIEDSLYINQDAFFSLGNFSAGKEFSYSKHKKENGVYLFLIDGKMKVNGIEVEKRDGIGFPETDNLAINCSGNCEILIMEVPMK